MLLPLYSQEEEQQSDKGFMIDIGRMFSKFYEYPKEVKNQSIFSVNFGFGSPDFRYSLPEERFSTVYQIGIKYGFVRYNPYLKAKDRLYNGSEYMYLDNISSHLKPKSWVSKGSTTDDWQYGFGYKNGWGYKIGSSSLMLNHFSTVGWFVIDFENPAKTETGNKILAVYDNDYKYGTGFGASIEYSLTETLFLDAVYSRFIVLRSYNLLKYMPGAIGELILQRTIDVVSEELIGSEPDLIPIASFVVKNSLSYLLYELRQKKGMYPFDSEPPYNMSMFSIGIRFLL